MEGNTIMANAPKAPEANPAAIAEMVGPALVADLNTSMVIVAGYLKAVRESKSGVAGADAKDGVTAVRIELEKWRKEYLAANKADDGADPLAALRAAGAAFVPSGNGAES
jgi:hypothetical protein